MSQETNNYVYIIMGVSGSGKSSVGQALAASLGWDFFDADNFHPPENIVKMTNGISLTDHDRAPWLMTLHNLIRTRLNKNRPAILTCSALKERYRQILSDGNPGVRLVYLKGDYQLICERMQSRSGHYMKADMLKSQFDDLEEPKNALVIDAELPLNEIILMIRNQHEKNTMSPFIQKSTEENQMDKANFGIMGLGVMGHMLALNMERNGFKVAGYDLDLGKVQAFGADAAEKNLVACESLDSFLATLELPRRILMMVPAGKPVDAAIASLKPHLAQGDLLIDGGNTFFPDTERRSKELEAAGIIYIGTGVSGGEQGALWGPAIMPGGQPEAWGLVKPIFETIAAKAYGEPCVAYMGPRGAGHYVKMVHNGIEYGDMQLIAEAYDILHRGLGLSNAELHEIFAEWNRGELESYLIEITADIFAKTDPETGSAVVDLILDEAAQKGTGKWTSQNALDLGAPTPTINAAVESRIVSAYKEERVAASQVLTGPETRISLDPQTVIAAVRDALYAAKICSYAQGFGLLRLASKEYDYNLNYGEIAKIWRGGCIIRARFLNNIRAAFSRNPNLPNLMVDPEFAGAMNTRQSALRLVVMMSAESGIPALAFSSALAYYDAYRSARLPANLTQAQRDYFGAHTYRRVDKEGVFHTEWQ